MCCVSGARRQEEEIEVNLRGGALFNWVVSGQIKGEIYLNVVCKGKAHNELQKKLIEKHGCLCT